MAQKKQLFISLDSAALPRWKEAFSKAQFVVPSQLATMATPDLVWLRLQAGIPVANQIAAVRSVLGTTPLLVLSDLPEDEEALEVFGLGARGYANSHASAETLKQIASVIDHGGLWVGENIMQRLLTGMQRVALPRATIPSSQHRLTGRELEVARAIAAGASNKEVARTLAITERTVKAHVSGLFTKLAVSDRLQLALKMREIGD